MSVTAPEVTGPEFDKTPGEEFAQAAGVPTTEPEFVDYFGFVTTHKHFLPDGKQYFEFQTLNEGKLAALQSGGASEVIVQRATGDAKMKVNQAKDRHALIRLSLINWYLMQPSVKGDGTWVPVAFNDREISRVLNDFPPHVIAELEKAIRKENPALRGDRSVEDIDSEMEQLKQEREEAVKREQGK